MNDRPIDEGRTATDTGFQVNTIEDGIMNDGRSYSGSMGSGPHDVLARESEANRKAVEARRLIIESEMDMNDLLAPDIASGGDAAREALEIKRRMGTIANHMVNTGAQQVINDAYMNPNEASMMMEQEAYQPAPQNNGWQVVKKTATLKSGKQIPVFMVEDSLSGMNTGKKYRLHEVAEKVSRVINATGNPSDARVTMINNAYEQHVKLMREKADARKNGNTNRVRMIESKLQEVNTRLGIA